MTKSPKKRLWKYELVIWTLALFISLGIFFGLIIDPEFIKENNAIWVTIWFYSSFLGIPLMVYVIWQYRKQEQELPSGLTKMYYSGRAKKQCTICQQHPVSKKYHLKSEHKMKDVNVDDYFRDCGCAICAKYSNAGG